MSDYARFVERRRPLWDELEEGLVKLQRRRRRIGYAELEELALTYRRVLHDHALATARFPGTGAARRLARLAFEGHRWLHQGEERRGGGIVGFFTVTFPRALHHNLSLLALAAALFAGAAGSGLVMAATRPGLGLAFLGPAVVEDLARGKLWTESLTTTTPPAVSSSAIATNNLGVALTAWAGGALAAAGSLYIVLLNGFFLGAVTGITLHYGLAGELLEFISAHGILEITLILVAAAAGLDLGRAMIADDERPRSQALTEAGRRSLALVAGCLPWLALLAVVETLVSPSPELSAGSKVAVGVALELAFFATALGFKPPADSTR